MPGVGGGLAKASPGEHLREDRYSLKGHLPVISDALIAEKEGNVYSQYFSNDILIVFHSGREESQLNKQFVRLPRRDMLFGWRAELTMKTP